MALGSTQGRAPRAVVPETLETLETLETKGVDAGGGGIKGVW